MEEYWLLGQVNVPAEKKQEFNENVLTVLERCGIRKTVTITLAGKPVTVLEKPQPDEDGIVSFNYSIFEDIVREVSTFNTNTGVLTTTDRGGNEFGLTMNLILLLQECYSNGSCFFMDGRRPNNAEKIYMGLLCSILNKKIINTGRSKAWNLTLALRNNPDCDEFKKISDIWEYLPYDYYIFDDYQMDSLFGTLFATDSYPENNNTSEISITDRSQISKAKYYSIRDYMHSVMQRIYESDANKLEAFLKKLFNLPLSERKKLAKEDSDFGILAECSQYLEPAYLVASLSCLKKWDFWEVWDSFEGTGYTDVINEIQPELIIEDWVSKNWGKYNLYKIFLREDEDEFLEFWDGTNLVLSGYLKLAFKNWKELFDKTDDEPELSVGSYMESYLAQLLQDMRQDWHIRYADKAFVDLVLAHKTDANWRRALLTLRKVMDHGLEFFPELDRQFTIEWLKPLRDNADKIEVAAYCSLIENEKQRKEIFGF